MKTDSNWGRSPPIARVVWRSPRWLNDGITTEQPDLVKQCDDAGIEFMLPIARWIGYGGETDFHGNVLETVTWAAGLAAHSKNIQVFATVHTFNHPIVVAKQLATLDQLSNGRIGLNVVAGWNKPEYDAFGMDLPSDHSDRYAMAQEWFDYVTRLWQEDSAFDWEGIFQQERCLWPAPPSTRPRPRDQCSRLRGRSRICDEKRGLFVHAGV